MSSVNEWSLYAQTAEAAYAGGLLANQPNANIDAYVTEGMSQSQAEQFSATWNVLRQSGSSLSGFSAVLLQNRMAGEKVLAIAGTNGPMDVSTDIIGDRAGQAHGTGVLAGAGAARGERGGDGAVTIVQLECLSGCSRNYCEYS